VLFSLPSQGTVKASNHRLSVVEYRNEPSAIRLAATLTGRTQADVRNDIVLAGLRAMTHLGTKSTPFSIVQEGLRIENCAGFVGLARDLELEICPKFLSPDEDWQDDFYFLISAAKHGALLRRDRVGAGTSDHRSFPEFIAHALVEEFRINRRHRIRTYRSNDESAFAFDGDIDPVEIALPPADGYPQRTLQLTHDNATNRCLRTAATSLLPDIRSVDEKRKLLEMARIVAPRGKLRRDAIPDRLPGRQRRWQLATELAQFVLDRRSLKLRGGRFRSIGFLVPTWQVWQRAMLTLLRHSFGHANVHTDGYTLGRRGQKPLKVYPDYTISFAGSECLADAKYKVGSRVGEADIYESLAFLEAANQKSLVLIYPRSSSQPALTPAKVSQFEKIEVGHLSIFAVQVECRGLVAATARQIGAGLKMGLSPYLT
jgi:5-methylcytosine-specific restriction enzyme subunit McrC